MQIAQRLNRHFGQKSYDKGLELYVFGHVLVGTLAAHYIPYIANRITGTVVAPTFRSQQIAQSSSNKTTTGKSLKPLRNRRSRRRYYRRYRRKARPGRRRRRRRRRY